MWRCERDTPYYQAWSQAACRRLINSGNTSPQQHTQAEKVLNVGAQVFRHMWWYCHESLRAQLRTHSVRLVQEQSWLTSYCLRFGFASLITASRSHICHLQALANGCHDLDQGFGQQARQEFATSQHTALSHRIRLPDNTALLSDVHDPRRTSWLVPHHRRIRTSYFRALHPL